MLTICDALRLGLAGGLKSIMVHYVLALPTRTVYKRHLKTIPLEGA